MVSAYGEGVHVEGSPSWVGTWALTEVVGFVEWLQARGVPPDESAAELDALENHTTLKISQEDGVVAFVWVSAVRRKLRKVKQVREYRLDGTTPTIEDFGGRTLSTVAFIDGSTLVHHVDGFLGPETHRRDVESGRLIQRMSLDTPSGAGSDSCTLIWRRV